jgi:4-amino-4-deoxy-L-arabinose transferase-like glycosyltransferase
MKIQLQTLRLLIPVTIIITVFYLAGLAAVPFHPDESTQIYMSSDVERFFDNPADLFWQPQRVNDPRQLYRELDSPLPRYLIGFGRLAAGGLAPLATDWDWSKSWQHNLDAGAYPGADLLLAARLPSALLFPFSLVLIFFIAKALAPQPVAWLAIFFYAANALVLLHTRRAMAEAVLMVTILLTLYSLIYIRKHPWLAAAFAALAFSSKHSAGVLLLPVLVAVIWQPALSWRARLAQLASACILFAAIFFLLNPFLWSSPLAAAKSALRQRSDLVNRQVTELRLVNPEKVLDTLPTRLAAQIGQLYLIEPAIWDISNYIIEQHASEQAYLANPWHRLLRSPSGGFGLMLLSVYGVVIAGLAAFRQHSMRRTLSLVILAFGVQLLALLLAVPLPFQRYVLPLTPFVSLWSAIGLWKIIELALGIRRFISLRV